MFADGSIATSSRCGVSWARLRRHLSAEETFGESLTSSMVPGIDVPVCSAAAVGRACTGENGRILLAIRSLTHAHARQCHRCNDCRMRTWTSRTLPPTTTHSEVCELHPSLTTPSAHADATKCLWMAAMRSAAREAVACPSASPCESIQVHCIGCAIARASAADGVLRSTLRFTQLPRLPWEALSARCGTLGRLGEPCQLACLNPKCSRPPSLSRRHDSTSIC